MTAARAMQGLLSISSAWLSRAVSIIRQFRFVVILCIAFFNTQVSATTISDRTLTIAVAANFKTTLEDLVKAFSEQTATRVRISSASTGILYAQIISGAPFDLFLSADALRPKLLAESQHAVAKTRFTYALGQLVLWVPGHSAVNQHILLETTGRVSLANPDTAPYGFAARQYLQNVDLWNVLQPRLVYGSNVAQSFQHVVSGNAQLCLTALSLLNDYRNSTDQSFRDFLVVPGHLYSPIEQQGVLLSKAARPIIASEFIDFMKSTNGRSIIFNNGYQLPKSAGKP